MRILVVGGTGFIGRPLVRELARLGHAVTVFHRGLTPAEWPAETIRGERGDLARQHPDADVVIDLILSSGRQAQALMEAFRGRAGRVVAIGSGDVYRACARVDGSQPGPIEPTPLTEDSPLRTTPVPIPPGQIAALRQTFPWLDNQYDKVAVERAVSRDPQLPATVLRLPTIYGPGDHLHRLFPILKLMDEGRPMVLAEGVAACRAPRGFVENVAAAIALAATDGRAAGRIYNVAEAPSFTEREWIARIAAVTGRHGEIVVQPGDGPSAPIQDWDMDSSRIRRELGYRDPVPLDEALRRTIAWQRENPPQQSIDQAAEDSGPAN